MSWVPRKVFLNLTYLFTIIALEFQLKAAPI
jgi:hypothetical protein